MPKTTYLHLPPWLIFIILCCATSLIMANVEEASASAEHGEQEKQFSTDGTLPSTLKGKLIFAHVLYRHGDRTPIEPYPTDPWKKREYWPVGFGQLTNIGKRQHYELGKWLRQRYDSILNLTYSSDEIYVRSTDVDRTLASAMSNLAGMYPPVGDEIWNTEVAWQPIPVHTVPEKIDKELAGKVYCASYEHARSTLLNSVEFQKLNQRYQYLYDYLTKYTGRKVNTLEAVQRLNNTFFIETLYNRTLPEWTKKIYPSADMTHIADFAFSINTYTRNMARLKVGTLIKEILQRFVNKSQGSLTPNRSVWIYSAHDTTVANVLNALKLYDMKSPGYTACLLFELRLNENNEPFVSIFYKNTTQATLLNIPDCGVECPLEKMYTIYKEILPLNWEEECQLSTTMMPYDRTNIAVAVAVLVTVIGVMLLVSYILMVYFRRRRYHNYAY